MESRITAVSLPPLTPEELLEEEEQKREKELRKATNWVEPDSDEEDTPKTEYDVKNAWKVLSNLHSCQHVMITDQIQRALQLQVGVHVSQEFPWKQIRYKYIRETLFDNIENGGMLHAAFQGCDPETFILFGYAPLLTQNDDDLPEGDPFIFYINTEDAKTALSIIRVMEQYEYWQMNKRLEKKPRQWTSLGSEIEIARAQEIHILEPVKVEIQSVYPLTIPAHKEFAFRKSADVRDGYVELVPTENMKFDNITRKRITVGIQSSGKCVDLAQQTDPTFPTNAWAQYLYEIKEGEDGLDETSEEEEAQEGKEHPKARTDASDSKPDTPDTEAPPKPPPEISDAIKFLLKTLEFNQIDMYRLDYTLICDKEVKHYTNPYLEETLCFANISKSFHRYVCGIDWYPALAGLIVASYTFTTPASVESASHTVDRVQRAVLQPNPILMWSFSDNLNYKLEFESPLEVTTLSFCPHNYNLLFGGGINGQLTLWDLQSRAENLDTQEILTAAQSRYRAQIGEFLKWAISTADSSVVPPTTATSLEVSQKAAITGIYWLGHRAYINTFGKLYATSDYNARNKFFITTSMDGTITFWNLDAATDKKGPGSSQSSRDQAKALTLNESVYKNKVFKPVFTVAFNEPITSIVADTSVFKCLPMEPAKRRKNKLNYRTKLIASDPDEVRQSVIVSTYYGRIERLNWLGIYSEADGRENVTSSSAFARVHDGCIIAMKKNPFYPSIFASIGRTVFAVWKEDYSYSPIFWRKRSCDLTTVAWSEDRPGVLFITRIDGFFEAWDIMARDDDASFNDILGGGIITAISEHRPSEPEKLLGIGDYNSSFRMVKLPPAFYVPLPNELKHVKAYILKEESRKKSIQAWEQKFFENNRDIIEAKRQAEIDAHKEMERIEKETMLQAARKAKEEADEKSANEPKTHLPYSERMRQQWDELNLQRLMSILMSRKRVNEEDLEKETALEKRRLAYEASKKESLVQILQRVGDEVATIRSRILPAEVPDLQRNELILAAVGEIMKSADSYSGIEAEANAILDGFDDFPNVEYIDFLSRGTHRRQILMKSLGGNTERLFWYENMKNEGLLEECNWGYESYLNAEAEAELLANQRMSLSHGSLPSGSQLDGSNIPSELFQ